MTRNLKVLGLALVAVFAMSAMAASSASAATVGVVTSDGPLILTGTDEATGNKLVYPGLPDPVICPGSHYKGEKDSSSLGIPNGVNILTVTPTYTNCRAGANFVTVTMNGCDYTFTLGETTGGVAHTYGVTADLICPAGKKVEVHAYFDSSHFFPACTIFFGEQKGLKGPHITFVTGGNGAVVLKGTFTNIKANREGACGTNSTEGAEYETNVKLTGESEASVATAFTITD